LEAVLSPRIVHTTTAHDELKRLAPGCLTQRCIDHYLQVSADHLVQAAQSRQIRCILHAYRCLLAGLRLAATGLLEANLRTLNDHFRIRPVFDLISRKVNGPEEARLRAGEFVEHQRRINELRGQLDVARNRNTLPAQCTVIEELREFSDTPRQSC
jgi:hypothetical protein